MGIVLCVRSLAVLVPVFNEAPTVGRAVERLLAASERLPLRTRVIAVDDGSTDGSGSLLDTIASSEPRLTALRHLSNRGKGAALRTALAAAGDADIVLIHDADLEYDPDDHGAVLAPILDGRADAVIGSRFRGGTAHRVLYYWHSVANRLITAFSNALTNLNLSDIECCTKAFTRVVAERLHLTEEGFGVEPEIVAKLARMRLPDPGRGERSARVYEVPVSYAGRTYAEGKKIGFADGVRALWCIVKYRFF